MNKGALCVWCLFATACAYTPAAQERARVEDVLRSLPNVVHATVACDSGVFASDTLCATLTFNDDLSIHFENVGTRSFGAKAGAVVVTQASGLVPRVASCGGVGPPNFHRDAPLGHHFHPPLVDLTDAVTRYQEVLEEIEFWPQCPQYFELQDHRGANYRYCAHRADAAGDPPRPDNCR